MAVNPNFPVIDYAVCFGAGPSQSPQQNLWCSLTERSEGKFTWRRGKQYELDQVQPGETALTVRNLDGALDPANTASPYYGYVIPYRLFRARAQWPATPNLLTQAQYAQKGWNFTSGVGPYQIDSYSGWSVAGGQTYSGQFTVSCTVSIGLQATLYWYNASGAFLDSTSGSVVTVTSTPVPVTVTATAPAGATGATLILASTTTSTSNGGVTYSSAQVEKAAAPTTPVQPGIWYNLFTGYVERWPQSWSSAGNYGTMDLTIVDLFAYYANQAMLAPFKADLMALGPNFLYALDETTGATSFADLTNNRGPATITNTLAANTLQAGASVASGDNAPAHDTAALTGAFLGSPGPVLQTDLPTTAQGAPALGGGALIIPPNPATGLPGPPAGGVGFTRIVAVRATGYPLAQTDACPWMFSDASGANAVGFYVPASDYFMRALASNPSYSQAPSVGPAPIAGTVNGQFQVTDSDWHLFGLAVSADGKTLTVYTDLSTFTSYTTAGSMVPVVTGNAAQGWTDVIGAQATNNSTTWNWRGNIAFVCEIPSIVTQTQWKALWGSWRNAWAYSSLNTGESSDARYQRILGWAGYTGPTRLSAGSCTAMGPASDITGLAVLQALQNVVDTENGQHFIGADGVPVFQSRAQRYDQAPVATFGENTGAGEWPYKDAVVDFDPTRIANDIQVTQQYGNALYRQTDGPQSNPATSQGKFGTITLQRTSNSASSGELAAAASWLLYQNKDPQLRFEQLPLNPSAKPAMFPTVLGLELGTCVAVNRRPANVPEISMTGFVEEIDGEIDGAIPSFSVTLQVSNNAKKAVWKIEDPTYGYFGQYPVAY